MSRRRALGGGTLLWRARAASPGDDEPRILTAPGRVYTTGGGRSYGAAGICAFDAATGHESWRTPGRGVLYLGSGDRTLRALGAATGRPVWTYRLAAPALDITTGARAVYALDEHGAVYGIRT